MYDYLQYAVAMNHGEYNSTPTTTQCASEALDWTDASNEWQPNGQQLGMAEYAMTTGYYEEYVDAGHPRLEHQNLSYRRHSPYNEDTKPIIEEQKPKIKSLTNFRCKICRTRFKTRKDLQAHLPHHTNDLDSKKRHECSTCSKKFTTASYLAQHVRTHTQERPFGPCDHCGKRFLQLAHLQQHLRTHTGEKPYKCSHPGCEKSFVQLSNLQSHVRNHEATTPYKCNSCYKMFETESILREHILSHKATKHLRIHICHICGKSYAIGSFLLRHLEQHCLHRLLRTKVENESTCLSACAQSGWRSDVLGSSGVPVDSITMMSTAVSARGKLQDNLSAESHLQGNVQIDMDSKNDIGCGFRNPIISDYQRL